MRCDLLADVELPLLKQISVVVYLFATALERVQKFFVEDFLVDSWHNDWVLYTVSELFIFLEYILGIFDALIVIIFDILPPLTLIKIPYNDLSQTFFHDVCAWIGSFVFDLARTVASAWQAADIIFALSLRLKDVMRGKRYLFTLIIKKFLHLK